MGIQNDQNLFHVKSYRQKNPQICTLWWGDLPFICCEISCNNVRFIFGTFILIWKTKQNKTFLKNIFEQSRIHLFSFRNKVWIGRFFQIYQKFSNFSKMPMWFLELVLNIYQKKILESLECLDLPWSQEDILWAFTLMKLQVRQLPKILHHFIREIVLCQNKKWLWDYLQEFPWEPWQGLPK